MKLHFVIGNLCLIASIALLVLMYGPTPDWPALITIPAALLLWILLRKGSAFLGASVLLCVYVVLAVGGIMLHRPQLPLIFGSITMLIWWDLADFEDGQQAGRLAGAESSLQRYRLQSIAITASASTLLIVIGLWVHVHLPFGVIVLLILVITGCSVYAVRLLGDYPLSRK